MGGGESGSGEEARRPGPTAAVEAWELPQGNYLLLPLISCCEATGDGKRNWSPWAERFSDMHLLAELLKVSRAEREAAASRRETHTPNENGWVGGQKDKCLGKTSASQGPIFSSSERFGNPPSPWQPDLSLL